MGIHPTRGLGNAVRWAQPSAALLALLPLCGCIIAVGNSTGSGEYRWQDDHERPRMGITLGEVEPPLASQLGVDARETSLILSVAGGMPAERAGLRAHDVVVQVNGSDRASPDELRRAIRSAPADSEIRLRVIRGGQPLDLTVVLGRGATPAPQP